MVLFVGDGNGGGGWQVEYNPPTPIYSVQRTLLKNLKN